MGFAGGLAGLSAVSSGYDAAEKTAADTENTRAATEAQYQRLDEAQREADTKRQLDPILGRAFQHLMTGQVAPPQPPQNQPMAPPPGQPSMPGAQPMAPPQTGAPQGMPPPQQAAPHTPPPRNPETGAPEVNLQGVVKSIIAANPGIQSNPELFMRAISDPRVATILDRQGKEDLAELKSKYQQSALDLHMLMEDAVCDGPVYGIGATTRATPLIHFADIGRYLTCVVEVSGSEKIGTCIPGTSIPIVDEAKLIADQPPAALILSWHIAASIIPSLRAKGYGGKLMVPLPIARVIDDK